MYPHIQLSSSFLALAEIDQVYWPKHRHSDHSSPDLFQGTKEPDPHGWICLLGRLRALSFSQRSFSPKTSIVSTKPTSMILCPLVISAPASNT